MHRCLILVFLFCQLPIAACVDLRRPSAKKPLDAAQDYRALDTQIAFEPDAEPDLEFDAEPIQETGDEPLLVEPSPIDPPYYDAEIRDTLQFSDAKAHQSQFYCPEILFHEEGKTTMYQGNGAWCVVSCDAFSTPNLGWNCYNFEDRTVKINGKLVACGSKPLPPPISGRTIFEISAGSKNYSAINWWNSIPSYQCPLPDGGI